MTPPLAASPPPRLAALRWPLPALLSWGAAWATLAVLSRSGVLALPAAVAAALLVGALPALFAATFWRRAIVAGGFPLSLLCSGAGVLVPAWIWLLPLAALALAYPVTAWRDAPVFPTPLNALLELERHVALTAAASVLDAGCGLGHGLQALRATWPQARLQGIEWSWPLAWLCRLRCPWARVERGDMWAPSWAAHDLVYLFQRPESMARAHAKAQAEMRPGSWLVSLEFEAAGRPAHAVLRLPGGRPVWIYRMGANGAAEMSPRASGAHGRNTPFRPPFQQPRLLKARALHVDKTPGARNDERRFQTELEAYPKCS